MSGTEGDTRKVRPPREILGHLSAPGDKSISHRSVILNAIARGRAEVRHFVPAADCLATVSCVRALGVSVEMAAPDRVIVYGAGPEGLREPEEVLDGANSGTTMRLLAGLLASRPFLSVLTGDSSLRTRPMGRLIQPLRAMGARIYGRQRDSLPPLAILGGPLRGIEWQIPVASAQLKSALLIAGLHAEGPTTVLSPAPSRDHTERLLGAMGARVKIQDEGRAVTVWPQTRPLAAVSVEVPGDISSAAFWLALGCAHPRASITVHNVGVNPTRTGLLDALEAMGARLTINNRHLSSGGEPVADLTAASGALRGVEIGGDLIPRLIDELPVLAVVAALAQGRTVVRDAAELRVKETDRISTLCAELRALGAKIEERADGFVIEGRGRLLGGTVHSHGDHRLAMALAIAGLLGEGETAILGAEVVAVSYPGFWQDMEALTGEAKG